MLAGSKHVRLSAFEPGDAANAGSGCAGGETDTSGVHLYVLTPANSAQPWVMRLPAEFMRTRVHSARLCTFASTDAPAVLHLHLKTNTNAGGGATGPAAAAAGAAMPTPRARARPGTGTSSGRVGSAAAADIDDIVRELSAYGCWLSEHGSVHLLYGVGAAYGTNVERMVLTRTNVLPRCLQHSPLGPVWSGPSGAEAEADDEQQQQLWQWQFVPHTQPLDAAALAQWVSFCAQGTGDLQSLFPACTREHVHDSVSHDFGPASATPPSSYNFLLADDPSEYAYSVFLNDASMSGIDLFISGGTSASASASETAVAEAAPSLCGLESYSFSHLYADANANASADTNMSVPVPVHAPAHASCLDDSSSLCLRAGDWVAYIKPQAASHVVRTTILGFDFSRPCSLVLANADHVNLVLPEELAFGRYDPVRNTLISPFLPLARFTLITV